MKPTLPNHLNETLSKYDVDFDQLPPDLQKLIQDLGAQNLKEQNPTEIYDIISAQNDIAFHIDKNNIVLWFKSDECLAHHHPPELNKGAHVLEFFPRGCTQVLTPLLSFNEHTQEEQLCELEIGLSCDQPAFYHVRILSSTNNSKYILLKDISSSKHEEMHFIRSIKQLEEFNKTLVKLNRKLNKTKTTAEIEQLIQLHANRSLSSSEVSFWFFNKEQTVLSPSANTPTNKSDIKSHIAPDYFEKLSHGRAILFQNRNIAQSLLRDELNQIYAPTIQAVLETPIRNKGEIIGVIRSSSETPKPFWGSNEQTFVASLADFYMQASDSFQKEHTQEALSHSENRFKALTENSETAVFAFNDSFLYLNPALSKITQLSEEFIRNNPIERIFNLHFTHLHKQAETEHTTNEQGEKNVQIEVEIITPKGEARWLYITSVRSNFDGKACWLASAFDITERKTTEARLKYQATHDQLTGLPNRARLLDRVEASLSRASRDRFYRFTVLFINIDRFKVFNDSMGQLVGDQLLVELSKRIRICLSKSDIVARISGDEFAVFLDNTIEKEDAMRMVNSIQNAVSDPIHFGEHEVICSASIGIVIADNHYEKSEYVLRDAGIAMFYAKLQSSSSYRIFDQSMHDRAKQILTMETDLRLALRKQSLELYYQPIVCLKEKRTHYFEALIRWRKNKNTIISPVDFIPLAEESGVILELGKWVIDKACKQLAHWQHNGIDTIGISVNVSGKQFEASDVTSTIKQALSTYNVPSSLLKVEITETSMIENSETIQEQLQNLREIGCELYVDDFGTGYSSLSYLHKFPISFIKIDRSFVCGMQERDDGTEIVKAIIQLAHNLNLKVVAEGVETMAQLNILEELNCDYAQGFLFSIPAMSANTEQLITKQWNVKKDYSEKKSASDYLKNLFN